MNKILTPWRAIIVSVLLAASFATPLMASHASSVADRNTGIDLVFDDPEATFEEARIVHNVTVDGEKGMRVHAKFHVKYGKGVACRMIAYFYYDDAKNTPLKASSDPDYKAYHTTTGQVSASTRFTPAYDPAVYNDLQLFIPYEALNMESGDNYDLKFYLSLYDNEGQRSFGKSGWYHFKLKMP
jgi:hypothetical protein